MGHYKMKFRFAFIIFIEINYKQNTTSYSVCILLFIEINQNTILSCVLICQNIMEIILITCAYNEI